MSALWGLNFSREYHGLKKLTVFNLNEKKDREIICLTNRIFMAFSLAFGGLILAYHW